MLLAASLQAQSIDLEHFKDIKIRNIGPAGMSGRVTAIDVDLSDPEIIYAGTASGGVWKSTDGGIQWKPIFDDQPTQSIGSVKINQRNPSVIWVGTGEGNPRNSHNSGAGIYKSLDGGKSWKLMGLEATKTIHRIIVHRDNPDIVFAGAMGSIWGPNEERGVFRTKDGGKTWEKVLYVNDETGVGDMIVDPTNPDKILVALWEYGRKPWTFNSGGPGSGLYITYDGGDNWKEITDKEGLPKGELGRMGLAIAPSKPNIIYALVEAKENGLYKSEDGGENWSLVSKEDIGNRPFYYSELYVDSKNENRIYNLYSYVSRSEDGGKTFKVLLDYGSAVHPDHHAFWIHPDDPNYLIDGNDGGLNISRDGGNSWRFVDNLPLAQLYHVNVDMDYPYNVGGGMQDNGSWVGPGNVWRSGGITNHDWQEVYFGDGFDVLFRPDDSRYVYAMSQGGNVGMVDRETGKTKLIRPLHPDGTWLRFNWNAAMAQDPFRDCGIYYGSQFLHYSADCGQTWEIISPDLTTNDPEKQKQATSGGLTIDNTQAENHTTILAIAPSPLDEKVIWVGTDDGKLQFTDDKGGKWTDLSGRLPGVKAGSWFPYIEVSPHRAGEAYVVVNDYRRNDFRPIVFRTTDFGRRWEQIVDDEKVEGFALSIIQDPVQANLLWLGTDAGLYFSIDGGDNWTKYDNGFPSVQVTDMKIHPREHDLVLSTFGRAFWVLDDIRPFRELAKTQAKVLEKEFAFFEAPDAYLANYRSYEGIRFIASGAFQGDTRPNGALLTMWVKPADEPEKKETSKEKGKKKDDKVKLQVVGAAGDTIRTLTRKLEAGINRFTWGMDHDGVRYPSRRAPRPDDNTPGGREVLPGKYTILATYNGQTEKQSIEVHADPRVETDVEALRQAHATVADFEKVVKAANEGFQQLQDAKKTIKLVDDALVNAPDSTKKSIADIGKALRDTIGKLENLYMDAEDLKGIQRTAENLGNTLRTAGRYLSEVDGKPSQMAQLSLERARKETREVLAKIHDFMTTDFAKYQKKVHAVQYSLFKEYEPVKME
jgi:photosystem II stability/assembly factor-like uncharacterized protein